MGGSVLNAAKSHMSFVELFMAHFFIDLSGAAVYQTPLAPG